MFWPKGRNKIVEWDIKKRKEGKRKVNLNDFWLPEASWERLRSGIIEKNREVEIWAKYHTKVSIISDDGGFICHELKQQCENFTINSFMSYYSIFRIDFGMNFNDSDVEWFLNILEGMRKTNGYKYKKGKINFRGWKWEKIEEKGKILKRSRRWVYKKLVWSFEFVLKNLFSLVDTICMWNGISSFHPIEFSRGTSV